jgi:hypothetical protein
MDKVTVLYKERVFFLTKHTQETQAINITSNLCDSIGHTYDMTIYSFLDKVRKFPIEFFNLSSWKIYWEQRCKLLEWNGTQQRLVCLGPWQWHKKCWACVVKWYFWDYRTKVQFHKFWSWNFLCKLGAQNGYVGEIKWNLQAFLKLAYHMQALNISTAFFWQTLIFFPTQYSIYHFFIFGL